MCVKIEGKVRYSLEVVIWMVSSHDDDEFKLEAR